MAITLGQTAIWILEALKEEKRREPDFEKCKTAVEIFTPMRDKHCLCDADITEAVTFLCRQGLLSSQAQPSHPQPLASAVETMVAGGISVGLGPMLLPGPNSP